jgi:hypothetical protein
MAWSYSGDPSTSAKDKVRFEIQDTEGGPDNEETQLLQDAEIEYVIAEEAGEEPSPRGILSAAARCAEILAQKFSLQADTIEGSLQQTYSKAALGYTKLAERLRRRAQGLGAPSLPAISRQVKRELRQDRERVQPMFRRDQHRMPAVRGENGGLPQGFEN